MKKETDSPDSDFENPKTCFFSNFPPKECGIATFTKNLSAAMDKRFNPKLKSKIIAINEDGSFYNYPNKVILQVEKSDIETYIEIAKKVNESDNIKIVCVQHEFGIFGGEYGNYIIPFLEAIKKPVVVTFHSVLPGPDEKRKKVVCAIAKRAAAIIVMANIGVEILNKDYGIDRNKIHVVHHGIPNVPYVQDNTEYKKKLKLDGRIVLSTFGLLSRGKGIEYAIKALPPLVKKYPNLLYLVIGETHPAIRKQEGEKYRSELIKLVKKLKIQKNVKFYNKYLSYAEIIDYVIASEIYIASNLEKNQITSGTLIEAMGYGGTAIVSTASIYAKEVLADGRGMPVAIRSPPAYTEAIDKVLSNPDLKKEMERLAYAYSRKATWSNVAYQHLNIFNKVVKLREEITEKFPKMKLNHIIKMTDDFGLIQFSKHSTPDILTGYTLDDNARALIFSVLHNKIYKKENSGKLTQDLVKTYLNFIEYSQEQDGNFKNHHKNEEEKTNSHSQDSFGRAIWSLGFTINNSIDPIIVERAKRLFDRAFSYIDNLESPRSKAFAITGLYYYYKSTKDEKILNKLIKFSNDLLNHFNEESSEEWHWFESILTYSNARLPEAMFLAYDITKDEKYLEVANKTLKFLTNLMFIKGEFAPIGQNGWYNRNGERAFFDQQPLDVSSITTAYLTAHKITEEKEHLNNAIIAFNWFLGKNHLKQMMYDETTGGCYDGLGKHSVNLNQGAESTVSYYLARMFLEEQKRQQRKKRKKEIQTLSIDKLDPKDALLV
ncbi:glycosyltransferase [Candidatus Pacearchaeota archaeon]|nr:glycosyltransferase [Candidatus Pacearchaeota archaeon]